MGRRRGAEGARWLLGLSALAAGCQPALNWREVRPEGTVLRATMPCKPATQARKVDLAGKAVRLSMHACRAGEQTWALAWADVADPSHVASGLRTLREAAQANVLAARAEPWPLQVPGATPNPESGRWRLAGRRPDGRSVTEQLAVFTHGTQVFQATVLGEAIPADAADAFFGALRVQP